MKYVRIRKSIYTEVEKRLKREGIAVEIATDQLAKGNVAPHALTGERMVTLAVECSGHRFHSLIADLAITTNGKLKD